MNQCRPPHCRPAPRPVSGGGLLRRRFLAHSLSAAALAAVGTGHFLPAAARAAGGVPEPAAGDLDTIMLAQCHLDDQGFTPGRIDGRSGEFTRKAVAMFNLHRGHPQPADWGPLLAEARRELGARHAIYQVRERDLEWVDPQLPHEPEQQAGHDSMPYRSLLELVAERYHCDERLLARLNPRLDLAKLRPGDLVVAPNVSPFNIHAWSAARRFAERPELARQSVVVDTAGRLAVFYRGETIVASMPITPGEEHMIPRGRWALVNLVPMPNFRWDRQMLEQGVRGDQAHLLPPGPNNPVGILWAGLNRSGIGLHGTAEPATIGRARSAGCVRFANWDAARLPNLIRPGSVVEVL